MYMDNVVENPSGFPLELYVTTSKPNVSVNVIAPGYPLVVSLTDSLTAGTVKQFNIPKELRQVETGLERKAILVEATDDVVVYGVNKELFSNDAFLAYPTDTLGMEYFTVSYAPPTTNCEFGIVGVVDGTSLEITFPSPSGTPVQVSYGGVNYGNGDKLTVPSFNRSHTLQIRSQGDLTGTFIKATNPVAVFSGNVRTAVGESESRDHLVEQIPPIRSWGTEFVTVPIPRRTVGDLFRIIASVNNTAVTISGMPEMTIDRGEFVQVNISSTMYASIRATRPILVMQIVYSQFDPDEPADPAMITVPPTDQFAQEYSFLTPVYSGGVTGGDYTHLFLLAIREEDRNGLWLDGQPLNSTHTVNWNRISGTNFVGTWVNVSGGAHTVYHPNATFMGLLYGTADRETYGFPVGMRLADIAVNYTTPAVTVTTVTTEAPSTVTACTAALVEISDFNMALAFAIAVGVNLLTACLLIIATYKWRQAVGENKFEETMEIPYRPDSNGTIGGVGGVTTQPDPDHIDRNWLMNADDFEGHEKGSYDINSRL
ncbi:IgGFc-binding protein [Lingula anatina]|uniref:IgGFc-binding protein n=1 Tax=Lingula anatina TaxID=7574 RepID=A0A1S3IW71_LINAN|nr:IgGFc-binding protein [Lingula anatina]|eukprot:XP_013401799.1 IgGFc-binding protein [Lingula anatina]